MSAAWNLPETFLCEGQEVRFVSIGRADQARLSMSERPGDESDMALLQTAAGTGYSARAAIVE